GVNARTQVPVVAILLASLSTVAVLLVGHYDAILVYVESMDGLFFGLSALALFVLRHRARWSGVEPPFRAPGHPWTTILFVAAYWLVVGNSFYRYRQNALIVLGILLAGGPLYFYWSRGNRRSDSSLRSHEAVSMKGQGWGIGGGERPRRISNGRSCTPGPNTIWPGAG